MRPSNRNINQIRPVSIKTDIIKNSLADPAGQEKRINEQVNKMFGGINAATK